MRFAVIGAGCIGHLRAQALARMEGCTFSAIVDVDEARAKAVAASPAVKVYRDAQDLLAQRDIDAVVVSTPPQYHERLVIDALNAGKHVLCEKPLANSVEACQRMLATAQTNGKTLATGFNHRYFPQIQYLKQMIDTGMIGELDHVRAYAGHTGLSEFRNAWEYDKKVMGGGALMDVGIHIIDLARYVLGEVEEVYGVTSNRVWNLGESEDNGIAILRSPQGKHAILQATWTEWKGYRFYIEAYGNRGMVRAYYAPMMNVLICQDKPGAPRKRTMRFYPMTMVREKLRGWQTSVVRMFEQEFADFLRLTDGKAGAIADGFAGFRAVEIADAVYRSSREHAAIRLTAKP